MCLVSNERRENALDNEAYSLIKSCVVMKKSHRQNGFPFYWDTLYSSQLHSTALHSPAGNLPSHRDKVHTVVQILIVVWSATFSMILVNK